MEHTTDYTNKITPEQVSCSIEYTRYRKFTKFYIFTTFVLLLELAVILFVLNWNNDDVNVALVTILVCAMFGFAFVLMLLQIIIFSSRMKTIERGVGTLPVYKVVFERIEKSAWNGTSFVVEIPDGSGRTVKTRGMFSTRNFVADRPARTLVPALYVDDFQGRELLVMYNADKNKVYVLDFVENFALPTDTL